MKIWNITKMIDFCLTMMIISFMETQSVIYGVGTVKSHSNSTYVPT